MPSSRCDSRDFPGPVRACAASPRTCRARIFRRFLTNVAAGAPVSVPPADEDPAGAAGWPTVEMPPEVGIFSFVNTWGVFDSSLRCSRALRAASASESCAGVDGAVEDCPEVAAGGLAGAELIRCVLLGPSATRESQHDRYGSQLYQCAHDYASCGTALHSILPNQFRCGPPGRGRGTAKAPAAKVTTAGIRRRRRAGCALRCCRRAAAPPFAPPRDPGRCLRIWWCKNGRKIFGSSCSGMPGPLSATQIRCHLRPPSSSTVPEIVTRRLAPRHPE